MGLQAISVATRLREELATKPGRVRDVAAAALDEAALPLDVIASMLAVTFREANIMVERGRRIVQAES